MSHHPTPIIIISSLMRNKELNTTFDALNAGALSVIEKPVNILGSGFAENERQLINSVRALAKVSVVRRRFFKTTSSSPIKFLANNTPDKYDIVAIGLSTGGPEALKIILPQLPKNFPLPIVIVLHITAGFINGLLSWLQSVCALKLELASHQQPLIPGRIYFAPDDRHLTVKKDKQPIAVLEDGPKVHHLRPSITTLFNSLSSSYPNTTLAGLLTGMGSDGSTGLLALKNAGSYTFAQTENTCTIYGMPMQAKKLGAIKKEIDLNDIADFLTILTK